MSAELRNFEEIARGIIPRPGSVPSLACMDVCGRVLPLNGIAGGDHLIYVDFKKRYDLDARIMEVSPESFTYLLRAAHHRVLRKRSFCVWDAVTCPY